MSNLPPPPGVPRESTPGAIPPSSAVPPAPPSPPPASPSGRNGRGIAIGCGIAVGVVVLLIIGVAVLLLAVGDAVNERFGDADPADYELEITGCGTSEGKLIPSIVGRLTNTSDLERGWRLDVYVNDGDVRVGERDILIDPLPSGSAANIDRVIPIRDADPSAVTCTVEVNYWRIEG